MGCRGLTFIVCQRVPFRCSRFGCPGNSLLKPELQRTKQGELHLVWYNGDVGIGIYQELHDMILQYANPHAPHAWVLVVRGPWLVGPHMSVPRETTYVRWADSYLDSLLETRIITVHHTSFTHDSAAWL